MEDENFEHEINTDKLRQQQVTGEIRRLGSNVALEIVRRHLTNAKIGDYTNMSKEQFAKMLLEMRKTK